MENLMFEFRAVIKFLCKEGCAAKEIFDQLCAVYVDCAPSYSTELPDGQLSFGVDVSRSKKTRGPAGCLTLTICL